MDHPELLLDEVLTPKVRKDGMCYVCRKERPFNPQKGVPFEAYLADPFCSSVCAKTYFGTLEPQHRQARGDTSRHRGLPMKIRKSERFGVQSEGPPR